MALLKDIRLNNWVNVGYHKVRQVRIDADVGLVTILVGMWVSEAARREGVPPVENREITIPLSRFTSDIRRVPYNILHELGNEMGNVFGDATDDVTPATGPVDLSVQPAPPMP
jgi:hypothetical protein